MPNNHTYTGSTGSIIHATGAALGCAQVVWAQWAESSSASTTSGSTSVWVEWVQGVVHSSTATTAGNVIWAGWCQDSPQIRQIPSARLAEALTGRSPVSSEERARWAAREAELKLQAETEVAARKLAEAKAEVLLRQLLTPEQQDDLDKKRCFYLHSGGKKYRIDRGRTGNVKLVDELDQVVESYCIHPSIACPDADTMLAQKLLLETDIETFERVANITARSARGRNSSGRGLAQARG